MLRPRLAVTALVLIPTIAFAQRGGAGGGGGAAVSRERGEKNADWNSINGGKGGIQLSNRDLEGVSPIKLLVDKRKDLKLTDDQVKGLKDIEGKLEETNQPSFRALDSLRRVAQPPLHDPTDDDKARIMDARRTAMAVVTTIRDKYDASAKDGLALLDDTQRSRASELLDKQRKDAQDMLRDKLGGR
ncbi:MAG: hypothetical protein ACREPM_19370 [Gemmatimonadaceae bacterium]